MKIKKIKQIALVIMLLCIVSVNKLYSQQNFNKIKYGLFYNVAAVKTSVSTQDFNNVLGFPNKNATHLGLGDYYGLFLLYDFNNKSDRNIGIGLRLSFLNNISQFDYDVYDATTQTSNNLHIRNAFDCFSLAPIIQTNLYGNLNALFGLQFNIPILAEGIVNYNARDTRIYPTSTVLPRIQLGFNYAFYIDKNHSFSIIPEINAMMDIRNDVAGNFKGSWKSNYFAAGIAIQYSKPTSIIEDSIEQINYEDILYIDTVKRIAKVEKETIKTGQIKLYDTITTVVSGQKIIQYISKRTDTLFIPRNVIFDVKWNLTAFNDDGVGIRVDSNFSISSTEEYISFEQTPLLNKIFFAQNSSAIPSRYKQRGINSVAASNKNNLKTTIEVYYDILNIIGQRMNENKNYTLKLVGCNDNNTTEEKDNLELSKSRAESIKQYLNNNWVIDSSRIIVEARGLPENPSLKETEYLKMEENRRVEIYANDNSLFNPVIHENKLISSDFERLQIDAKVLSNEGIKKYVVIQKLNNKIIREVSVEDPERINGAYNFTEHLPIDIKNINDDAEMQIILSVITNSDNTKTSFHRFPINYSDNIFTIVNSNNNSGDNSVKANIDKNYLVLFGLNDADIEEENLEIIDDIKSSISNNSQIYIVGYSDINGNETYNSRLAFNRADNIRKTINLKDAIVEHSSNRLFDNALPEGRFYSRAVEITISSAKYKK